MSTCYVPGTVLSHLHVIIFETSQPPSEVQIIISPNLQGRKQAQRDTGICPGPHSWEGAEQGLDASAAKGQADEWQLSKG